MNDITVQEAYDQFIMHGSTYWALTTKKYYERNVTYFLLYLEKHFDRPVEFFPLSELPSTVLNDYTREFDSLAEQKMPQSLDIGLFFCQIFHFIIEYFWVMCYNIRDWR